MRSSWKRISRIMKWGVLKQRTQYYLCIQCFSDCHGCTNHLGNLVQMQFLIHIRIRREDSRVCIPSRLLNEVNAAGTWHIPVSGCFKTLVFFFPCYFLQSPSQYLEVKYMWNEYLLSEWINEWVSPICSSLKTRNRIIKSRAICSPKASRLAQSDLEPHLRCFLYWVTSSSFQLPPRTEV